jgi:hypothetical protein
MATLYGKGTLMNIQPNSHTINQFIEINEYFRLLQEQRFHSFIGEGLNVLANEELTKRISELEELEKEGFIFNGEKNWLLNFINNSRSKEYDSYDKWVADNFKNFVDLNFVIDESYRSGMNKTWKAIFSASDYLLDFDNLKNPAYQEIEELELYVGGNDSGPSPMHLCSLFDTLNIIEYSIFTLSHDTQDYKPLGITSIDVSNSIDPNRILINVISEYGSEFDQRVVSGKAWR